jgi:type IX secretion system PorP/SprF family membrane protein
MPFEELKGGLGVNLIRDSQAGNLLTSYQGDLIWSTILRVSDRFYFSGALQAGFRQNSLDWSGLVFADNLDPYTGHHGITTEIRPDDTNFHFFDFSTGIMLYSEKMFAGVAVHHLAEPSQNWYYGPETGSLLHRKYTLHFGTRIPVFVQGHWRKAFDISPQLILIQQGSFRQFNYGMLANYRGLTAGTWLRQDFAFHYDALIFLVGYMKKRWHFTYSYDFTVSGLGARTGGTSEISLSFLLKDFTLQTAFPFYRPYHDYIGK